MRIDYFNNKYKDISVNGRKNLSAKWEGLNGDKIINDVITQIALKMFKFTMHKKDD